MGKRTRRRHVLRTVAITFSAVAVALMALPVVSLVNPWPSAMIIRALFEKGARDTVAEMKPYVPATGFTVKRDIAYGHEGTNTQFDLVRPSSTSGRLTTVIWIHGGAWISGDKENVDPYLEILASHGYTTVGLNYTIAPEATYPTALHQLNDALAFLVQHADEYGIDPGRIVLAGDSAGAQYAAQLATITTNPAYADEVGMKPALTADQLRAVILNCGIYDVSGIPNAPGIAGWGFRIALWSYLGTKDWSDTPGGRQMSVLSDVTGDFPRTWISGGNGDPLTATQSQPLAARLTRLGVDVTPVFYPHDQTPSLPHEYQFHLKLASARDALDKTIAFLSTVKAAS